MGSANFTLRLEILREAYEQYKANMRAMYATEAERMMNSLKMMECETMIKELSHAPRPLDELIGANLTETDL